MNYNQLTKEQIYCMRKLAPSDVHQSPYVKCPLFVLSLWKSFYWNVSVKLKHMTFLLVTWKKPLKRSLPPHPPHPSSTNVNFLGRKAASRIFINVCVMTSASHASWTISCLHLKEFGQHLGICLMKGWPIKALLALKVDWAFLFNFLHRCKWCYAVPSCDVV